MKTAFTKLFKPNSKKGLVFDDLFSKGSDKTKNQTKSKRPLSEKEMKEMEEATKRIMEPLPLISNKGNIENRMSSLKAQNQIKTSNGMSVNQNNRLSKALREGHQLSRQLDDQWDAIDRRLQLCCVVLYRN